MAAMFVAYTIVTVVPLDISAHLNMSAGRDEIRMLSLFFRLSFANDFVSSIPQVEEILLLMLIRVHNLDGK